jgi:hypothetical protein
VQGGNKPVAPSEPIWQTAANIRSSDELGFEIILTQAQDITLGFRPGRKMNLGSARLLPLSRIES